MIKSGTLNRSISKPKSKFKSHFTTLRHLTGSLPFHKRIDTNTIYDWGDTGPDYSYDIIKLYKEDSYVGGIKTKRVVAKKTHKRKNKRVVAKTKRNRNRKDEAQNQAQNQAHLQIKRLTCHDIFQGH